MQQLLTSELFIVPMVEKKNYNRPKTTIYEMPVRQV